MVGPITGGAAGGVAGGGKCVGSTTQAPHLKLVLAYVCKRAASMNEAALSMVRAPGTEPTGPLFCLLREDALDGNKVIHGHGLVFFGSVL